MTKVKPKILVILGPTAIGKSALAVYLARKLNGEVISADSRQVYKGLNIGSGKITKKQMLGVRHYLIDVVSPKKTYSVSDYQKRALKAIAGILKRDKLPIICGGTGFYIDSLVLNKNLPEVPPNRRLRQALKKLPAHLLAEKLKKISPERYLTIDKNNPVRLIRAIEIARVSGKVSLSQESSNRFRFFLAGIDTDDKNLRKRIKNRLLYRLRLGMVSEVKRLYSQGISWRRLHELGLEYRLISHYLRSLLTKKEMIQSLETKIWQYAKRQRTWFRRNKEIEWFRPDDRKVILKKTQQFLRY